MATRTYGYFVDNQQAACKIEQMNKQEVGNAIKITYDRMKANFYVLKNLHLRLSKLRKQKNPTNSKKKVAKLLKINVDTEKVTRLETIIQTALVFLETDNFDAAKAILKQEESQ